MTPRDPYKYFRVEARELLEGLRRGVAGFASGAADPGRVPLLLRLAHTLKGAARVVKLTAISDLAHRVEDVLASHRESAAPPAPGPQAELHRLVEAIAAGLAQLDRPAPPAAPAGATGAEPPPVAPAVLIDTVRLQVAEVDAVLAGVGETSAGLAALRDDCRGFERAAQHARLLHALAARGRDGEALARLRGETGDLSVALDRTRQRAAGRVERLGRELQRLHDDTARLRLIPTEALWNFLARAARDAGQVLGKRVRFESAGRVPRLDAPVFAALQEALLHLVRNAVAHGLESAAERRAAAKPPEGCVRVRLEQSPGRLRATCEDDGRGIDPAAVRRAAVAKGWLAPEPAAPLAMDEAIRLLLRGGVTTAPAADEVSGRGVGLEVARAAVARLGGELTLASAPDRGTTVTLAAPVALAAVEALGVESAGATILLPLESVQRVGRTATTAVHRAGRGEELHWENRAWPFAALHRLVPSPAAGALPPRRQLNVVIVHGEGGAVALGVDRLLGVAETVVRRLPALADAAPFVAGAALGASGAPRLVLDPRALGEAVRNLGAEAPAAPAAHAPILVVDDSLTTRMLEQSILESAGYTVGLAVSGEDALRQLRARRYGLLLVDVEMPGMDGFTLIEQLRREPAWRELPAILVTSRESAADRQRGRAVGAQDYVIKGEFDQRHLLRRIAELLA